MSNFDYNPSNIFQSFSKSTPITGEIGFNTDRHFLSSLKTIIMNTNNTNTFIHNPGPLLGGVASIFLSNSTRPVDPFYVIFPQDDMKNFKFEDTQCYIKGQGFSRICDMQGLKFLNGSLPMLSCSNVILDFSEGGYFPVLRTTSPASMGVNYTQSHTYFFFKTFDMIAKCDNNCKCSQASNPNSCPSDQNHNCPKGLRALFYNMETVGLECAPCMANCAECDHLQCIVCDASSSFSEKVFLTDGTDSGYVQCSTCDQSCTQGCTGPTASDCIGASSSNGVNGADGADGADGANGSPGNNISNPPTPNQLPAVPVNTCDPDCDQCNKGGFCTACSKYPDNHIFSLNQSLNEMEKTDFFYCRDCSDGCLACPSFDHCVCKFALSAPFIRLDSVFNVCIRVDCPESCSICNDQGGCLRCNSEYELVSFRCFPKQQVKEICNSLSVKGCVQCKEGYYPSNSSICLKCPAYCSECFEESNNLKCSKCSRGTLNKRHCLQNVYPLKLPSLRIVSLRILIEANTFVPNSQKRKRLVPFCLQYKNSFSNMCLTCKANYYLSRDNTCKPCPKNALTCRYSGVTNTVRILQCDLQYFLSSKLNKCTPCSDNCLSCSVIGCLECQENFDLQNNKCVKCTDPNCRVCAEKPSCLLCNIGFRFSLIEDKCVNCKENCLVCSSSGDCEKCADGFFINASKHCQKDCLQKKYFYDAESKSCVNCSACEFCYDTKDHPCESCEVCEQDCSLSFIKKSKTEFLLTSPDIVFPEESKVLVTYLPEPPGLPTIHTKSNQLAFTMVPDKTQDFEIKTVIHKHVLKTRQCTLKSDIMILISLPASEPFFSSEQAKKISTGLAFTQRGAESAALISSLTPQSLNTNSVILVLNLNLLFSYSFLVKPPRNGLSMYFNRISRSNNFVPTSLVPLSRVEITYAKVKTSETNIKVLPLVSLHFFVSFFLVLLFVYFRFFYLFEEDLKVKELFPLFLKRRMDREYMRRFFQVYSRKISRDKMNMIIRFLRRTKIKIKSSKVQRFLRRQVRNVYTRRYSLVFFAFQSFCIELGHISAKTLNLLKLFPRSLSLYLFGSLYHCFIGFYCFLLVSRVKEHKQLIVKYLRDNNQKMIEEYILISNNLPFAVFSLVYVYCLVFLINKIQPVFMEMVCFSLFVASVFFERLNPFVPKKYLVLKILCNFPVLIVLHFASSSDELSNTFFFDFFFLYVNVSRVGLYVYEFFAKVNDECKSNLEKLHEVDQ